MAVLFVYPVLNPSFLPDVDADRYALPETTSPAGKRQMYPS